MGGDSKVGDHPVRSRRNLAIDPRIMMGFENITSDQKTYGATDEEVRNPVLLGAQPGRRDNRSQPVGGVWHPAMFAAVLVGKYGGQRKRTRCVP